MTVANSSHPASFQLDAAINRVSRWLPIQGPIKDFIHHNILHAVQQHPFHKGVAIAAKVYGARSYLPAADYQAMYRKGRIKDFAVDWAIRQSGYTPEHYPLLRTNLFIEDDTQHYPPVSLANNGIRNHWLSHLETDLNSLVHPIMFRLLGNFLDQGISRWTLSKKDEPFWACVWRLAQNSLLPLYPFDTVWAQDMLDKPPDEVILACLQRLVGDEALYEQYILELLLGHPGWSGMVRLIELRPNALLKPRNISLKELIAIELLAEWAILEKKFGNSFNTVRQLPDMSNIPLLSDYEAKASVPLTLQIWHEAMEYSRYAELMVALKDQPAPQKSPVTPIAQAFFCIDDRECSARRYLEEANPAIETFGAPGFFGIDFLYQGYDNAFVVAQCPNILSPKHLILESSTQPSVDKHNLTDGLSDLHVQSHSVLWGWLFTQLLGLGYAVKMVWDTFRPGAQLLRFKTLSEVSAQTHLHLLRENDEPTEDGRLLGFSFTEMADKVEGLLRNIGLTKNFAPLVVVVAHGSSSTNNPHFAAYECGACAGKPGAPNARAFAWMANSDAVRALLRERGIDIPDQSFFIGAMHNTSRDEITYFDPHLFERCPTENFEAFKKAMQQGLHKNAWERCRWFELAPDSNSYDDAHEHVKARASSIFEPRPEWDHSNNLYAIVGRRQLTKNLFLDRRSFLQSYDPNTDPDGTIIVKILSAIIPVCGGINLSYFFSRMDNSVYGAGTKLPHNVIGLLGVANGVEGDLRTGLVSQMIEVHEPARLLIVIEQTTAILDLAFAKLDATLMAWLDNNWVRLVACHPETRQLFFYHHSGWEAVELPEDYIAPVANCAETIFTGKHRTIPVHVITKVAATT